jgi:hypothetical protein
MVSTPTLTPAYGRDYKSLKAMKVDFLAGKDFIFQDISSPYDGKVCNLQDLQASGLTQVRLRYNRLTKVSIVDIPKA